MGLVKNTGVDTSVAASSVSSALIFMAKNAKKFKAINVALTDARGQFRDFGDIVLETQDALGRKFPDAAKRMAAATALFGRFGPTAFQAGSNQLTAGLRGANGELVRGAAALDLMRERQAGATGTAARFERKVLDTFPGKLKLLRGVFDTFVISIGKPFLGAMKAAADGLRSLLENAISFISAIPEPVKEGLAKVALGIAGVTTAIGGMLALKGAILLFSTAFSFLSVQIVALTTPLLIFAGVASAVGLAVAGIAVNAKTSKTSFIGDLRDMFDKAGLIFRGFKQILSKGVLSGPILDEFNKASNAGAKEFLLTIVSIMGRVRTLWDGLVVGFQDAIGRNKEVFESLSTAFFGLADNLGFAAGKFDAAKSPMSEFTNQGLIIGDMIAQVSLLIIRGLTLTLDVINAVKAGLDLLPFSIADILKVVIAWKAIGMTVTMFKFATATIASFKALTRMKMAMGAVRSASATTKEGINLLANSANSQLDRMGVNAGKFTKAVNIATSALMAFWAGWEVGKLIDEKFGISNKLAEGLGILTGQSEEHQRLEQALGGRTSRRGGVVPLGQLSEGARQQAIAQTSRIRSRALAEGIGTPLESGGTEETVALLAQQREGNELLQRLLTAQEKAAESPTQVTVAVDGERIATAVARSSRSSRAGMFHDVPMEGDL